MIRQPIAWRLLLILAATKVALHVLCGGPLAWGYMTDELYYLDSVDRLDWGFVDHPPFSIALLGLIRACCGDSMLAIRIVPALLGGAAVVLTGLLAREMGGGRTGQGMAALMALTAPVYLAVDNFYSMNVIEHALWPLCMFILLRIFNGGDARLWLVLGVVMAIGTLNKVSMLWFGAGLGVGLLLTPERRWLRTPWPWIAAAIAGVSLVPFVWWQWRYGWPFVEFTRNAALYKVGNVSVLDFAGEQLLAMGVMAAPLWLGGLLFCMVSAEVRRHRAVVWIFVTVALMLAFSGSARPHYLAPAYPIVLAAGGIATERLARRWSWFTPAAVTALVIGVVGALPLAMPVLSPAATVAYQDAIGIRPRDEIERGGRLPMHLALLLHADAVLEPITDVYNSLTPEERGRVEILTGSFGETGAVNVLGRKRGLPASIGTHNQYGLWGPGNATGALMIVVHDNEAELHSWFGHCERRRTIDCPYCMEPMQAKSVYVCRDARRPLRELWPEMKYYR